MEITLTHCRYAPSWEMTQDLIRSVTANEVAVIAKINRRDRGVNYRSPGIYDLSVNQGNGTILPVVLNIVSV